MPPADHRPRKRFGQNFLHDAGVIERIMGAVGPRPGDTIVEIGPGLGALTIPLLRVVGRLDVVEIDRDLVPQLQTRCAGVGELTVHQADALEFDFCRLAPSAKRNDGLRVVGNLPYNISTPLVFHLLGQAPCIEDMHFMLQKEVVERMAAPAGGSSYGRLSVAVQLRCSVRPLFHIARGAFRPQPRVDSTFVRLTPYRQPPVVVSDWESLDRVLTRAFGARRKTLRNALKGLVNEEAIRACGIDPGLRPERLELADFACLSRAAAGEHPRG